MVTETQDAMQESKRGIQNTPSRLETLFLGALGAISGATLTGAFLYDPLSAAGVGGGDVALGVAAAGVVGGVAGVTAAIYSIYLLDKTRDVKSRLRNVLASSALIASLATGAGYGISSYGHRINAVRPFQEGEEKGIAIETPRASSMYLLRDGTNYVSLDTAKEQDLAAAGSSYAKKEQGIKARYDKVLRATRSTNQSETLRK